VAKRRIVVYPGSFDPVTNGHLDLIQRAGRLFDHVVVAVAVNPHKHHIFSGAERVDMLRTALKPQIRKGRVSIDAFDGLLVSYARRKGATALVRGLRAISDFEFEFQMALMNRSQAPQLETVFLMPDEKYTYLSSTILKEITRLGGNVRRFVPASILPKIQAKLKNPAKRPPF
jgi:pantetheine-phosphate adenylyltransferase